MQRSPSEVEAPSLQFTIQRPGDLIYLPHHPTHTLFTLDTGSPTIFQDGTPLRLQTANTDSNIS